MNPKRFPVPSARTEMSLLIAFADLSRFGADVSSRSDQTVAAVLDDLYVKAHELVTCAGGTIVKPMGDAVMVVFSEDDVDEGVLALLRMKQEVDDWLARIGWSSRLVVKAHLGSAVAGPYGPKEDARFDVIGATVNFAATIETRRLAISAAAFRKLAPDTRKLFKKHTPPITYIPAGDPRPRGSG